MADTHGGRADGRGVALTREEANALLTLVLFSLEMPTGHAEAAVLKLADYCKRVNHRSQE